MSYCTSIKSCPYEIIYSQGPPMHLPYKMASSKSEMLDRSLLARELVLKSLKKNIAQTRNKMRQLADNKKARQGIPS